MDFHDMEQFRTGRDERGHDRFSVPLRPDDDGMVGRECPNAECDTKYFKLKIQESAGEDASDTTETASETDPGQSELVCPYCGERDHFQHFHTEAQIEWIKSMLFRDVARAFGKMLDDTFRPYRRTPGSLISVKVRHGNLPTVRHYVEEKLKQVVACQECGEIYAVYGISFHCPFCGKGALAQQLALNVKAVAVLAEEAERIGQEHGHLAKDRMYGNAYEDVVSVFEGFLKVLYRYAVKKRFPPEIAEKLLGKVKVNFQRVAGAEEFFERDFGVKLFDSIPAADLAMLESTFAKRHTLTHNLGLVDEKYSEQVRAWQRHGAEVPLERSEILQALSVVEQVVRNAVAALGL
jgi:predicted RNA-binding Zn-ribbon protein involved in translation (DUF1610 family)